MKSKSWMEDWLEYLPLLTILGFLATFIGAANRLDDLYFYRLQVVILPVWVLLVVAGLKIFWMRRKRAGRTAPPPDPKPD